MNATEDVVNSSATLRATVDLPEPEPPAIPMINGFILMTKLNPTALGTHYARWAYHSKDAQPKALP